MTNNKEELPFCECGKCGLRVTKKGNRFVIGHNMRGILLSPETCAKMSKAHTGVPLSPETCAAMSEASKGVPKSPEACAKMSKAKRGVPLLPEHSAAISRSHAESDVMRGGNDMVCHHIAYDFRNPETLRVKITRKFHGSIHHPKGIPLTERGYSLID